MTIEEAIEHAEEIANNEDICVDDREKHKQLAEWLKELIILRNQNIYTRNYPFYDKYTIPDPCRGCSNHPSNGGSGICNCTLGLPKITC